MLRKFSALLAAGALVSLSACGTGDDGSPAADNGDGDTRTITHAAGETEVPADLDRVVTLWAPTFAAMLSLDEQPVGYAFNAEPVEGVDYPEGFDIDALEHVGHSVELDFEEIAAVGPELIIGTSVHEEMYDQLSELAPTVILDWPGTGLCWGCTGPCWWSPTTTPVLTRSPRRSGTPATSRSPWSASTPPNSAWRSTTPSRG